MKRVLIIASHFPPEPSVGRHRIVKFCKYLPQFGWEPEVLTIDDRFLWDRDEDTLKELPEGLRVHRAFTLDPEMLLQKRMLRKLRPHMTHSRPQEASIGSRAKNQPSRLQSALDASLGAVWRWSRNYVWIPESMVLWTPFAVAKALRLLGRESFDVVMTTAPHYTPIIVGWWLKRLTGRPWVVDLRDLWSGNHTRGWQSPMRAKLELGLERRIMGRADHIVAVTPGMPKVLKRLHADFPPERIHVITNGYDDDDVPDSREEVSQGKRFTINYTGGLYRLRSAGPFLGALGELLNERESLREAVGVNFYGTVSYEEQRALRPLIDKYGLAPIVNFRFYVKHKEALRAQAAASVNLLIVDKSDNCDLVVPAKTYEYLAAGRPILALAPEGDCKRLIQETKAGTVCDPLDVVGIKKALEGLIGAHSKGELRSGADPSLLARFHRRELTGRLARVLEQALEPEATTG